jgi:hypothetical protein
LKVGQQGQDKLMGCRRILCIPHPTVPQGHVEIQTPCAARPNIVGCSGAGIKAIEAMDINTNDAIILDGSFRGSVPIVNVPIENSHFFGLVFRNGETRPQLVTDSMYLFRFEEFPIHTASLTTKIRRRQRLEVFDLDPPDASPTRETAAPGAGVGPLLVSSDPESANSPLAGMLKMVGSVFPEESE